MSLLTLPKIVVSALIALHLSACNSAPTRTDEIANFAVLPASDNSQGCVAEGPSKGNVSVLLIGNSLMNDVQSKLEQLLVCGGYTTDLATSNPGGYFLHQHVTNEETNRLIAKGYDLTLLQEQSRGILKHEAPYETINELKRKIEAAGSRMGFYQTWAFQERNPTVTSSILSRYESISQELGSPIVPIGRAWDYFYTSHNESPPFELFLDYAHATEHGKSLIAYVLYAFLTGNSPVNLSALTLSEDEALELQSIAWATFRSFSGQKKSAA